MSLDTEHSTRPPASASSTIQFSRITFIACALCLIAPLFLAYSFYPFQSLVDHRGHPLGADFPEFYVMGKYMLTEPTRIYDEEAQMLKTFALFPTMEPGLQWPVWYPPFVAGLFAPLALLPYPLAFAVFTVANVFLAIVAAAALWRVVAPESAGGAQFSARPILSSLSTFQKIVLVFGFPPVMECILGGQLSIVALCIVCTCILLLRRGQEVLAGMILALSLYKPNVLALFGVGVVILYPGMIVGALPVGAFLLLLSLLLVGTEGLFLFMYRGMQVASGENSSGTENPKFLGLVNWLGYVFPESAKVYTLCIGLTIILYIAWKWHSMRKSPVDFPPEIVAAFLLVNCLCNPYLPMYDVAILLVAVYELYRVGALGPRGSKVTEYALVACYCIPHLSQIVAVKTGVQFFPLLIIVLLVQAIRTSSISQRSK